MSREALPGLRFMIDNLGELQRLHAVLRTCAVRYQSEAQLQEQLADVLTADGFAVSREVVLSGTDRVDLAVAFPGVDGLVVIETKIKGSVAQIERQICRYAGHERVMVVMVFTTLMRHAVKLPAMLREKRLMVVTRADLALS